MIVHKLNCICITSNATLHMHTSQNTLMPEPRIGKNPHETTTKEKTKLTSLMASTCPLLFLTFFNFLKKYLTYSTQIKGKNNNENHDKHRNHDKSTNTRTLIWHGLHLLPKASCEKSLGAHQMEWGELYPQPGTDGTAIIYPN